jgi:hypothetical protein
MCESPHVALTVKASLLTYERAQNRYHSDPHTADRTDGQVDQTVFYAVFHAAVAQVRLDHPPPGDRACRDEEKLRLKWSQNERPFSQ